MQLFEWMLPPHVLSLSLTVSVKMQDDKSVETQKLIWGNSALISKLRTSGLQSSPLEEAAS